MVDPDTDPRTGTDDHESREEILRAHDPIHTYPRPKGKPPTGVWGAVVWGWAFFVGLLAGVILLPLWMGTVGALLGWILDADWLTYLVILLVPPAVGISWAILREPEHELPPVTKAFIGGMLGGYLVCAALVASLLAT